MSPQLCQRVKDVKQVVDLFNILNEGGTIKNMMPNDFDFRQFQVSLNSRCALVCTLSSHIS